MNASSTESGSPLDAYTPLEQARLNGILAALPRSAVPEPPSFSEPLVARSVPLHPSLIEATVMGGHSLYRSETGAVIEYRG